MATYKQKLVATKISENIGKPIGQAMREAGYSESTTKTPQRLTESKGWTTLIEKYIKEIDLARVHKFILNAKTMAHYDFPLKEKDNEIKNIIASIPKARLISIRPYGRYKRAYFLNPDLEYIDKALDKAYKVKGRYKNSLTLEQNKEEEYLQEITATLRKIYSLKRGTIS